MRDLPYSVPSARGRRGSYRVIYEMDDDARRVVVLRVDHRADVYRP